MPARNGLDDGIRGDNSGRRDNSGAGPVMLSALAQGIAGSAADPEDALEMCRDLANAENLDTDQYLDLLGLVEGVTGWELPEDGAGY